MLEPNPPRSRILVRRLAASPVKHVFVVCEVGRYAPLGLQVSHQPAHLQAQKRDLEMANTGKSSFMGGAGPPALGFSEGGMMRLDTFIELKLINSSFSSLSV